MSKLDQRGVVHLLVPLILLLGIIGGVYLITAGPLKLFPKASVSGPIGGVTYVDTKIGCGNPQGLTPDQICQQKGFVGAVAVDYQTAAKGYWWRQCGGASVSNCDRLNCKVNELDCTNTAGYWGSQQPYPENFTRAGTSSAVYKPADFDIQTCSGYSPGWTMRVACSLASTSPSASPSPSPSPTTTLSSDFVQLTLGTSNPPARWASGKVTARITELNEGSGYGRFEISGKLMALYPNETYQIYLCESPWSNSCSTDSSRALVSTDGLGTALISNVVISAPLQRGDRLKSLRVTNPYRAGPVDPTKCRDTGAPCLRGEYNISWQNSTRPRPIINRGDGVLVPPSNSSTPQGQGRYIVELLSYDRQTDNAELGFNGNLTGLVSRHIYQLWVCWPDRISCSGNSYPRVIADGTGTASFDDDIITVFNRPNNRVSWIKLTEVGCLPGMEREPGCSSYGAIALENPFSLPPEWLFPSPTPSPSPSPIACTINDLRAAFFSRRGEPKYNPACDINNDGRISVTDYSALLRNLRR